MSKICIDSASLQTSVHLQDHNRLNRFIALFNHFDASIEFCDLDKAEKDWMDAVLLVIPTRISESTSEQTLGCIEQYVSRGGGLFLLSNHSKVPTRPMMGDFTHDDKKIAALFDIELLDVCMHAGGGKLTHISHGGESCHKILQDSSGHRVVESICVNNGSAIAPTSKGCGVLWWPGDVVDVGPYNLSSENKAFCWANDNRGGGRVLVMGDSGFMADPESHHPGPGLIDHADNELFLKQCVAWLLNIL